MGKFGFGFHLLLCLTLVLSIVCPQNHEGRASVPVLIIVDGRSYHRGADDFSSGIDALKHNWVAPPKGREKWAEIRMAGQKLGFREGFVPKFSDQHYDGSPIAGRVRWENWDNRATFLRVRPGAVVAAFEEEKFGGANIIIRGPAEVDLVSIGWGAKISSAAVLRCNDLNALRSLVDI